MKNEQRTTGAPVPVDFDDGSYIYFYGHATKCEWVRAWENVDGLIDCDGLVAFRKMYGRPKFEYARWVDTESPEIENYSFVEDHWSHIFEHADPEHPDSFPVTCFMERGWANQRRHNRRRERAGRHYFAKRFPGCEIVSVVAWGQLAARLRHPALARVFTAAFNDPSCMVAAMDVAAFKEHVIDNTKKTDAT